MDFRDAHARLRAEREAQAQQAQARLASMSPRERKRFFIRTAVGALLSVVVTVVLSHLVAGWIVFLILVGFSVAVIALRRAS